MANVSWLIRRLKAMSIPEVLWRLSQKGLQKQEERRFGNNQVQVTSSVFNRKISELRPEPKRLHINYSNQCYSIGAEIHLLGGAAYSDYKKRWNAGFQTVNTWPDTFSYKLEYKQRDEIGDARTNWELNRHFQFVLLAKDYFASRQALYLKEFEELFTDWNRNNTFLHGISWTSVMEVAIRCSNWIYAYAFLSEAEAAAGLLENLRVGILNMTDYIAGHYSRYSSANNHLIVEAYVIGLSGIFFDHREWIELSVSLLTRELPLQNYSDGVNKELSLHYQSFYMEAMGLMMRLLVKNAIAVPSSWAPMLEKMCRYVADCIGKYGETVVFGDDDEGKILDLQGGETNHYLYVLNLLGILLGKKYMDGEPGENIRWLFTDEEIQTFVVEEKKEPDQYCIYKEGGNTILRSRDRKVLIGIDHAALGFGSIAAHGHADALSFQLFYKGKPVFADPGTYIYHCDLEERNEFRRTRNHNTVCINDRDQSEMLGAFLWGRKANATLISMEQKNGSIELLMEEDGYAPVRHCRNFSFDGDRHICIEDRISDVAEAAAVFVFAPDIEAEIKNDEILLLQDGRNVATMRYKGGQAEISEHEYSARYGLRQHAAGVRILFNSACRVEIALV